MMIAIRSVLWFLIWLNGSHLFCKGEDDLIGQLQSALKVTESSLSSLRKEWQVEQYPNFLKSCFMHKSSWDVMKYKYMKKILLAFTTKHTQNFVVSFTGSSVTAGHDSDFNASTSVQVGQIMQPAFKSLNLYFNSRNVALGNNPCIPYDICVKIFAGYDADVVHWEQNYFCDGRAPMEHFIRQAMTIPTHPIVIYSEANTNHWGQNECSPAKTSLTTDESKLLASKPLTLATEVNKDEFHRAWRFISDLDQAYVGAGIQTFTHWKHRDYACQGPYIKNWMEGAASWHPSVIAHRLRASHHSYWWLQILKDAIEAIIAEKSVAPAELLKTVDGKLAAIYKPMPAKAKHHIAFVDNMTCHTDYVPRAIKSASLKALVLAGITGKSHRHHPTALTDGSNSNSSNAASAGSGNVSVTAPAGGWQAIIYENLVDKNLVQRSMKRGYLDFKHLIYTAEDHAGPLSMKLSIDRPGPIFLCQTPGIWGALPKGFQSLWEAKLDVYLTMNTPARPNFAFSADKAEKQYMSHDKELDICVQLKKTNEKLTNPGGTTEDFVYAAGEHILSLVPSPKQKIIFAWLIHT